MSLAANALTTLSAVYDELGTSPGSDDTRLARLINAASDTIEHYCNRTFGQATYTDERITGFGDQVILVKHTPITALASISYDGTELDSDEYRVRDAAVGSIERIDGVWEWAPLRMADITGTIRPGNEQTEYTATYTAGYVLPGATGRDLPYDLEQACIGMVATQHAQAGRDLSISSERQSKYSVSYGAVGIPASVQAVLDRYRRIA